MLINDIFQDCPRKPLDFQKLRPLLKDLHRLKLEYNYGVFPDAFPYLLELCPQLKSLDLGKGKTSDNNFIVQDWMLPCLHQLKNLEVLTICGSAISNLTPLTGLPLLRELSFQNCNQIKDISPLGHLPICVF